MDNYTQIKDIRPQMKNINVVFIVLEISHPTLTKENREVRTFKVADQTACINASVWDEAGQLLNPGDICRLTKGYASVWRGCLTLYTSKQGDIQKIGDFCLVFNEQLNMSDPNQLVSMMSSPTSQPNNVTLNNGTNNGASRLPPQQSSNAIMHNNVAGPIKSGGNTPNRFPNNDQGKSSNKNGHNRGRGAHNRSGSGGGNGNNSRERR